MQELVLSVAVVLSLIVQMGLLYHCFQFKGQMPLFVESLKVDSDDMKNILNNASSILMDITDILEENGSPPNPIQSVIPNPSEFLLNALTSKFIPAMTMPDYGEEKQTGPILEEESKVDTQEIQEQHQSN